MTSINSTEFQRRLGEIMDRVAAGERVTVTRYGRPFVVLLPFTEWEQVEPLMPKRRPSRRGTP